MTDSRAAAVDRAWLAYASANGIHPYSIDRDVFEEGFDAALSDADEKKRAAYKAVWDSGLLTPDVYTNARIWRAVEAAVTAAFPDNGARE